MLPVGAKGERTRAALVRVAIDRFAHDGYRRASLTDIAGRAGVTPTAVYRYFDDKESLFTAAVDADAEALVGLVRSRLDADDVGPSLVDLLDLISEGLAEAIDDHPLVLRVLADRDMVTQRVLELPSLLELRADIASLLELLQAEGMVRASIDAKSAALALESIVLNHLADLTAALPATASIYDARWHAIVELVEASLKP